MLRANEVSFEIVCATSGTLGYSSEPLHELARRSAEIPLGFMSANAVWLSGGA